MGIESVMRAESLQPLWYHSHFHLLAYPSLWVTLRITEISGGLQTYIWVSQEKEGRRETVRRTGWLDYLLEKYRNWALPFTVETCYVASGHSSTPNIDQHQHWMLFINTKALESRWHRFSHKQNRWNGGKF